jgi:hypothetical protein
MERPVLNVALAMALCAAMATPASAQNAASTAPTKLKSKTPEGGATVTVVVTNARKTDLVELQAAESGSVAWKKVLGGLKTGAHASAQFPKTFNCRFDLHGTFSDGQSTEASGVDVCAQKTLNLTD